MIKKGLQAKEYRWPRFWKGKETDSQKPHQPFVALQDSLWNSVLQSCEVISIFCYSSSERLIQHISLEGMVFSNDTRKLEKQHL